MRLVQRRAGALVVGGGGLMYSRQEWIVALAARHGLPAMSISRDYVAAGALKSAGCASGPTRHRVRPLYDASSPGPLVGVRTAQVAKTLMPARTVHLY
jgi:hypothetical protein